MFRGTKRSNISCKIFICLHSAKSKIMEIQENEIKKNVRHIWRQHILYNIHC